jgi:hypothetical protein
VNGRNLFILPRTQDDNKIKGIIIGEILMVVTRRKIFVISYFSFEKEKKRSEPPPG